MTGQEIGSRTATFSLRDYDLDQTLNSGQAFRWRPSGEGWEGVIEERWVRLVTRQDSLIVETFAPVEDWTWLKEYLQLDVNLDKVITTFPKDEAMRAAVAACRGLRLLRQPPWECLASFILSSTKQIVQIRQIIAALSERFGDPLPACCATPAFSFPSPETLASASEEELRACKMGFRAPYLHATARLVAGGKIDLVSLFHQPLGDARARLMQLPGVGRKVADCVLLFAFGFQAAFPIDVWVLKALRELYFPQRKVQPKQLRHFADTYFGSCAGYAQQYLFHYLRVGGAKRILPD